jgi:peptidoglycan-associated lipoprotein
MKFSSRLATLTAATAVTVLLGACSSTPVATPPPATDMTPKPTVPTAGKPAVANTVATTSVAPHLDPASAIYQKRSVYFDFDQYTVKPEYTPLLEMHGKYLAAHRDISIRVEGNTDEQGGTEYNLALGQKRAEAVVRALKVYGAKDTQLEAVSFGKEKPKSTGHDDAARAQNRRGDLAYPQK